jgi:hypothetical protein
MFINEIFEKLAVVAVTDIQVVCPEVQVVQNICNYIEAFVLGKPGIKQLA